MGPRMYTQGWTAGTQHYSVLAQQPTLALKPLPTFAVYLDPRPQSWFHGQVGWVVAEPVYGRRQGNYGVNNRKKKKKTISFALAGAGSAESRWGREAASSQQTAGMCRGPGAPWAAKMLWAGPMAYVVGGHIALGAIFTVRVPGTLHSKYPHFLTWLNTSSLGKICKTDPYLCSFPGPGHPPGFRRSFAWWYSQPFALT